MCTAEIRVRYKKDIVFIFLPYMTTNHDNLLYLPVSLGEAIDKLTILDIKLDKITDDRKRDVKIEYDLLYDKLKEFIIKYENLYDTMKKVNLLIWDMMDILRDETIDEQQYLKICKECTDYNDVRFRIKNKINCVSASLLKEQKSYKINRFLIILSPLKKGNCVNREINSSDNIFVRIIKYLSFMYDEIWIVSDLPQDSLKEYFSYDTTILFTNNLPSDYKKKCIVDCENDSFMEQKQLYNLFDIHIDEINKLFI